MTYAGLVGAGIVATLEYKFQECIDIVANPAQITAPHRIFWLRMLWGRTRSRFFGSFADFHMPVSFRIPAYRLFAWRYDANLDEIRYPLDSFKSFAEFFARPLKEGARPVSDMPAGLVSPVDGQVLTHGVVSGLDARIEQVKGSTYNVTSFLGLDPADVPGDTDDGGIAPGVTTAEASVEIRYIVLYLPMGCYHRFHSPAKLTFFQGRHFCGETLPAFASVLERVPDIFSVNERVVLSGRWHFGQMHLVAVASTNVGNIWLDFDAKLKTNRMRDIAVYCGGDISSKFFPDGVELCAGETVGGFRLGSTVVLVFDAPHGFEWNVARGDSVRVGQPLGEAL